ncbi:hypothetical protein [uncultured Thiothrix sp.]|uniref:hypothetical protein n=1 Tax=uncultured Thiothrix sp. TaxID=223185 RepID=UPI002629BCB0|nr:hypothetical protein [uncultured Thiothrix sp.]HMT91978.1 hypothetical protein [Thiolinea sp.]
MKLRQVISFSLMALFGQQTALAGYLSTTASPTATNTDQSVTRLIRPSEVDPKIYGKTIGNWGHTWWEWAFNIPKATNPLLKNGAIDCSVGQQGKVWFLAGNFGGTSKRSCTIPQGKALFFPISNSVWWTPAPGTDIGCKNELHCRKEVGALLTNLNYTCKIDGQDCAWKYAIIRAQSDSLPFTIKTDSILVTEYEDIPGTRDISISDGYWVMLPPLPVGDHKIRFTAKMNDFALDVSYTLKVN